MMGFGFQSADAKREAGVDQRQTIANIVGEAEASERFLRLTTRRIITVPDANYFVQL